MNTSEDIVEDWVVYRDFNQYQYIFKCQMAWDGFFSIDIFCCIEVRAANSQPCLLSLESHKFESA